MTIHIFKLPDIGEGTAEAELVAWHVGVGDVVEEDQPIADVMTDKATVELTAPVSGTVIALHGTVGAMAQVGAALVEFGMAGAVAGADEPVAAQQAGSQVPSAAAVPAARPASPPASPDVGSARPKASPAVRTRAKALGVPLEQVKGSGPHGRIRQPDLETWLAYHATPVSAVPVAMPGGDEMGYREVRLVGLRRKIAEKMEVSTRHIPHFAYVEEVDVTELERARAQLNAHHAADRPKLSFLPFFIHALCRTLPRYPQINATYDEAGGVARYHMPVHVGIATQTDNGLVVPVLRDAGRLGLWEIAAEIARLAAVTRSGAATREALSGSTITITSLGTLGGLATTPVINHPEVAIIGPNKIVDRPMAHDGGIALRKMMNISSSFDHRVVDGYDAARFVQDVRALLEAPTLLLAR